MGIKTPTDFAWIYSNFIFFSTANSNFSASSPGSVFPVRVAAAVKKGIKGVALLPREDTTRQLKKRNGSKQALPQAPNIPVMRMFNYSN